jgi:hypothetical protein
MPKIVILSSDVVFWTNAYLEGKDISVTGRGGP